ncbi:ComEC/Rec2 family competence protein [Macromonas bipunctata]|uniref:ComEC/Rec2 family competence protein n=1 Tax=Macromonas bipunctata TaxID=183670 RepID=UPI000C32559D|nr:ComEC/Rec2 family competence protein [Macromonas bipunctata]
MMAALAGGVLGVALQLQQVALWATWAYALCAALGLGVLLLAWRAPWGRVRAGRWWRQGLCGVALALCALALTGVRAGWHQAQALAPALDNQVVWLEGQVTGLPRRTDSGWRFEFQPEAARWQEQPVAVPPLVQLSWGAGWAAGRGAQRESAQDAVQGEPAQTNDLPTLRAGQRWRLTVRLRRPHGLANPGGFDTELWYWTQGLHASGQVRTGRQVPPPELLDEQASGHRIARARQAVRDAILARVPEASAAGMLAALSVGDQASIENDAWTLFRRTGINHLVSVSGLHVTMFAWLAVGLVGGLWRGLARVWPGLLWRVPTPVAAAVGGVVLAAGYALLSGWGVPAQRTVWMLATVTLLRLSGRRWPWPATWLLVMNVVLLLDPWALLQAGFWLSFVAVGVLFSALPGGPARVGEAGGGAVLASPPPPTGAAGGVAIGPGRWQRVWVGLRAMLREQAVVTVALAPLTLMLFGQFSLIGLLANLLAIPWVTFVVTPLAMLGVAWPPLWDAGALAVRWLMVGLQGLSALPWATLERPDLPWTLALLGAAGGLWLVQHWPWRWRAWGLLWLWPALAYQPPRPPPGAFEIVAADVGQGTAVVVRTARHTLLYDTGPPVGRHSHSAERVLLPLLRAGGDRLDAVVVSHADSDHASGLASVAARFAHAQWWTSFPWPAHATPAGASVPLLRRCEAGQHWEWDGVRFELLHPGPPDAAAVRNASESDNARSCVLRVGQGAATALLPGDIGAEEEQQVLARYPGLRATVLLAGHHGSRSSNSAAWLDALQPAWVLVQSGRHNPHGHPHPDVVARWQRRGVPWVNSPGCGAAVWRSHAPQQVQCQRERAPRYWHAR